MIHTAILAAVLIVPLLYTQTVDLQRLQLTYLEAPPMPGAPPPPLVTAAPRGSSAPRQSSRRQIFNSAKLSISLAIPKTVQTPGADLEPPPEIAGVPGGLGGEVPDGQLGGAHLGGLGGPLTEGPGAPPTPSTASATASGPSGPLHVGGEVKPPQLLYEPAPEYPRMALGSRIQGDVEIDAVIDKDGNVVQAQVVSGPPALISAALKAVSKSKYAPTYLNGKPYPVELTVHWTFVLGA